MELLERTGVGCDINRRYYTRGELESQLTRPVVWALADLVRFRNTHPAVAGSSDHGPAMIKPFISNGETDTTRPNWK